MYRYTESDIEKLTAMSNVIRRDIITMTNKAKSGHPGGSLSAADVIAVLYFHIMNIDPKHPDWSDRDRFILSKGHCCPALYSALAHRGYFDVSHLDTLRQYKSILQGHPDMRKTPGIDMTSGSLGNGLACGVGMALSAKLHRQKYTTYVMLGDGECQEGMVWEAAMAASHHSLDNLVAIVDCNGIQINGWVSDIMTLEPLADKWRAFGWYVVETDGHDIKSILDAFHRVQTGKKPAVILSHTVKGKGISYMEDVALWHGQAPNDDETELALNELSKGGRF